MLKRSITFLLLIAQSQLLFSYLQPAVNLGLSNILDGGPLRPDPGLYWIEIFQYYQADKFLDGNGKPFAVQPCTKLKEAALITEFLYQFPLEFLHANPGIAAVLPATLAGHIHPHNRTFTDLGSGVGDLLVGFFLQGKYFKKGDRPIFIQRFECDVSFPTGKFNACDTFTPGNGFYFLQSYWSATLYFTRTLAASWRLNYLWNARDKKTGMKAGSSIFGNFDLEYEAIPNLWVAFNGYFLNQLTDDSSKYGRIHGSRESVVGLGPGAVYFLPKDFDIFVNAYFETGVKNRAQGWKILLRLFKQF